MMDGRALMRGKILLMDGSIRELLGLYGAPPDERALFDAPDTLASVYREFAEAGVDILSSLTLNANRFGLRPFGWEDKAYETARSGAALARRIADSVEKPLLVAGTIGQIRSGHLRKGSLISQYKEQIRGLADGGADLLHLRGFSRPSLAECALEARDKCGCTLPVILTVEPLCPPLLPQIRLFYDRVAGRDLLAFGICGFYDKGATDLMRQVASFCRFPLVCCRDTEHGDALTSHRERAERLPRRLQLMAREGLLNIAGGNRGAFPSHLCGLRTAIGDLPPRKVPNFGF